MTEGGLSTLDLWVIGGYCGLVLLIGLLLSRRASANAEEYFLSGRSLPWWLAGTSMAATSFSVDTPLYVTALVRDHGIYRNWEWWSWAVGGAVAAFVFAPLWRRARVLTDVEFTQLRYQGRAARWLRSFRALYLSIPINCIAMASVYLALRKVLEGVLGWDGEGWIWLFGGVAVTYSLFSGFWGVVVTDLLQFVVALVAAILIAGFAVAEVGGLDELVRRVEGLGGESAGVLSFLPPSGSGSGGGEEVGGRADGGAWFQSPAWIGFFVFLCVAWWANQNADGGGKIIQRMSACKDERHAWMATLWFNVAHYGLRTWPWILAALATLILLPDAKDSELAYPRLISELLPSGWRGFALVSLIAAFMSTIDTQLNWGASYLVNDLYRPLARRFGFPKRVEVPVSWGAVALITGLALLMASEISSIKRNFHFLIAFGSGAGSVYVLRWFWWRVTPFSEMTAMVVSGLLSSALRFGWWGLDLSEVHPDLLFPLTLLLVVAGSTVSWLAVTLLWPRPDPKSLIEFYRRVRPGGAWGPVKEAVERERLEGGSEGSIVGGEVSALDSDLASVSGSDLVGEIDWSLSRSLGCAFLGSGCVLGLTLGLGQLLLGSSMLGWSLLLAAALSAGVLWTQVRRR